MGTALDEYKARVRAKAIEVAREEGWCTSGLNSALEELDLDPVTNRFRVTAHVLLEFEVTAGDDFDHELQGTELHSHLEAVLNGAINDVNVEAYETEWSFESDCSSTRIDSVTPLTDE